VIRPGSRVSPSAFGPSWSTARSRLPHDGCSWDQATGPTRSLDLVVNRLSGSLRPQLARTSGFLAVQLSGRRFRAGELSWLLDGERGTEEVAVLGSAGHLGAVLGELLAAGAGEPASRPVHRVDHPASKTVPTSSPGTPTVRSAMPSLSKSTTASAWPNWSPS
jgi:hypothetical protein